MRFSNGHLKYKRVYPYLSNKERSIIKREAALLQWRIDKARYEKTIEIREQQTGYRSSFMAGLVYLSRYISGKQYLNSVVDSQ